MLTSVSHETSNSPLSTSQYYSTFIQSSLIIYKLIVSITIKPTNDLRGAIVSYN